MRVITATLYCLFASPAGAWDGLVAAEAQLGLASPTGMLGLALDVAPEPWWAVNLGAGLGSGGWSWSVQPRIQTMGGPVSIGGGVGLSGGEFVPAMGAVHYDHAVWGNTEVSLSWMASDSWQLRSAFGYGVVLNDESCEWTEPPVPCELHPARYVLPFTRFAAGYVF